MPKTRTILVAFALAAFAAAPASAGPVPTTGADFTTVNESVDGPNHCKNGNPGVNCNQYDGKRFVWLNGGPPANKLGPSNTDYFWTVLAPGGQPDPNDAASLSLSDRNLSDDYDCYQNRIFRIGASGEVTLYPSPTAGVPGSCFTGRLAHPDGLAPGWVHDSGIPLLRLFPYSDTPNPGGVYIMAICSLANGYPVNPSNCKYDAFKIVPPDDRAPPICALTGQTIDPTTGKITAIQITVEDPDSGIDQLTIESVNATITTSPASFPVGYTAPVVITATKDNLALSSFVKVTIKDVGGLITVCDPILPATKRKPQRIRPSLVKAQWTSLRGLT